MKWVKDFAKTVLAGTLSKVVVGVLAAGGFSYGGIEVRWAAEEIVENTPPPERPGWVAPVQTIGWVDEPWEKVYPGDPDYPIEIPEPELEEDVVEPENGWYEDALPEVSAAPDFVFRGGFPADEAALLEVLNEDEDDDGKWIKRPPK